MNLKECLNKGYLFLSNPDKELAFKEINESKYDLEKAKKAFVDEDYKWSIIKSYYSMFHAAKYILFNLGYKEKRHIAVLIVLEEFEKTGKISSNLVTNFKAAMTAREDADYHYSHSKEIARHEIEITEEFLEEVQKIEW
jgi:uncharacterized protein (UPF0332 family)